MNNDDLHIFEPVVILPAQISGSVQRVNDTSGPIALMLAVLEEAVWCIERGRRRRNPRVRKLAAEAESWMRCDSREWPFAFASICDVLGLDVDAVRASLLPERDPADQRETSPAPIASSRRPSPGREWPRSTIGDFWGLFLEDDLCLPDKGAAAGRRYA